MTKLEFTRSDEKATAILKAVRLIDEGVELAPVVHGRWIGEGDGYADGGLVYDIWHCSECNYCIDDGTDDPELLPRFCPNCGAKMDGDSHD